MILIKRIDASFIRFIVVGLSNTLISFAVFKLSLSVFPDFLGDTALAQSLSYATGLLWSYFWNRKWSFRSGEAMFGEFGKFVILQLALLALSAAIISVLVDIIGIATTLSWIAVMFFITIINFFFLKSWVFRSIVH